MTFSEEDLVKLGLSILLGGLIGAEREYRDKSAGFRTLILICVGSCLFTIFSIKIGITRDQARIAAAVVSGVGFLGGGAILRDGAKVAGLTTASTIWLSAALGMGVGGGYFFIAGSAALMILVILWLFPLIELRIDNLRLTRAYEMICEGGKEKFDEIEAMLTEQKLKVYKRKRLKREGHELFVWEVNGRPAGHERLVEKLFADPSIKELSF